MPQDGSRGAYPGSAETAATLPDIHPSRLPRTLGVGHNNCFMNVVVQSLWHLTPCRQQLMFPEVMAAHDGATATAEQGLCRALQDVFAGLLGHRKASSSTETGVEVVDVELLREALKDVALRSDSKLSELATAGDMADAIDAMGIMLHSLKAVLGEDVIDELFTLKLREQYGDRVSRDQNAYTFSVNVLFLKQAAQHFSQHGFEVVLRNAAQSMGDVVLEDGKPLPCHRILRGPPPAVFSLELIQDSLRTRSDPREIATILSIIHPRLDLHTVFDSGDDERHPRRGKTHASLKCFFCFHPHKHHYIVYCYNPGLKLWLSFDDDEVTPIGRGYREVAAACSAGGFMPHVLFYEVASHKESPGLPGGVGEEFSNGSATVSAAGDGSVVG